MSTGEDHSKRSLPSSSSIYRQTSANSSQLPPLPQTSSESLPPWFNDLIEHGFNGLLSIVTKNLSKEEEEEKDEKEEKDVTTTEEGDDGQAFGGNRGCAISLKESDDHHQESPNRGQLIGKLSLSLSR